MDENVMLCFKQTCKAIEQRLEKRLEDQARKLNDLVPRVRALRRDAGAKFPNA
jgi:hypothetical protein